MGSTLKNRPGTGLMRYITFEDTTAGRMNFTRNVAYVFQCNGEYISDSIAVRKRLANLRERYGYYMKVEVQTFNLSQPEAARRDERLLVGICCRSRRSVFRIGAPSRQGGEWAARIPAGVGFG